MTHPTDYGGAIGSAILGLMVFAALIAAAIAFFNGPAKRSEDYVNQIANGIHNEDDRALFRSLYHRKGRKSVLTAWLLTVFLSPTVAYIYLGENNKALIAFLTCQGAFLWWFISWFTMPAEAMAKNNAVADDALIQLRLMRPNMVPVVAFQPSR